MAAQMKLCWTCCTKWGRIQIEEFVAEPKTDDPFRLMGFGHRVYKNYDPKPL